MQLTTILLVTIGGLATALPTTTTSPIELRSDARAATLFKHPNLETVNADSTFIPSIAYCTDISNIFGGFDGKIRSLSVEKGFKCNFYKEAGCGVNDFTGGGAVLEVGFRDRKDERRRLGGWDRKIQTMRDLTKKINGLSESDKDSKQYTPVQADLSKPETVKQAVQKSGATSAFVYTIFESADNMRSTFCALKKAGIEHVVLLSSYSIKGPAEDEQNMRGFIQKIHAKTEVALRDSGISFIAVRPMYFTSNLFWHLNEIRSGTVQLLYPDIKFDYISPTDIGTVCGALLSEPYFKLERYQVVPLCGPELYSQRQAMELVGNTLGRKIEVQEINEEVWYEKQLKQMPRPVIDSITNDMRASNSGHDSHPDFAEVSANISKYAEREPTKLKEWLEANKAAFE
ncbi:hypothetical protein N0V95_003098 [Ascochyta clinopodiicola]|nr:hypothetical protein N0V95_003098 [Ascochyta clinopodiicola]